MPEPDDVRRALHKATMQRLSQIEAEALRVCQAVVADGVTRHMWTREHGPTVARGGALLRFELKTDVRVMFDGWRPTPDGRGPWQCMTIDADDARAALAHAEGEDES